MPFEMKVCAKCKLPKPFDEFREVQHGRYIGSYCVTCERKINSARNHKNHNQGSRYGLEWWVFELILKSQDSNCPICELPLGDDICVDHSAKTGKVRGLIHNGCNLVLGWAKDSPRILRGAANYLEKQDNDK